MRQSAGLLGVALACALAAGCDDLAPCDAQGDTQPCECAGGEPGAQICLPELIWAACDCTSAPAPDGGGQTGAGGAGGTSGSTGASGASGASGAGGTRPPAGGTGDEDAGSETDSGGTGGSLAGSGGSGGGTAGASGEGGAPGPMSEAYRDCMNANGCDMGATCLMSPPGLLGPSRVCAPACSDAADCPMPEGTYDADVTCAAGRCRIDCTEMDAFPLPIPQSCPEGMVCIVDEFPSVTSYCYDDGL